MEVRFSQTGDFRNLEKFLNKVSSGKYYSHVLRKYADEGVRLLEAATPKDTGVTADSWDYEIFNDPDGLKIIWTNTSRTKNKQELPLVQLIIHGHATRGGTWIAPNDFVTPAMQPLFDKLANSIWEEVTR